VAALKALPLSACRTSGCWTTCSASTARSRTPRALSADSFRKTSQPTTLRLKMSMIITR
jgi:hypothetical protein